MKIYDSVHGFIHFNEIEALLIDSEVFQRLHLIHQLGICYKIYPGATHTRFEHSLGTMHLATKIFDQICKEEDKDYWRQVVRLAALCHDLGHLPFSHVGEKALLGTHGHEEWTLKIIQSDYLSSVWETMEKLFSRKPIVEHVAKLAIGEEKLTSLSPGTTFTELEKVYSQIVTGDFFGSDRIDYLLRDAKATGLSYGLFDYVQLIEMLVLLTDKKGGMSIGVEENGIESCEALLLGRHFMQRRVYQHPTTKAYSFHLSRFMQNFYRDPYYTSCVSAYLSMSEPALLVGIEKAKNDRSDLNHLDALALSDRSRRFKAVHLGDPTLGLKLEAFKKAKRINDLDIHWEFTAKKSLNPFLDLLILKKNAQVATAQEFFDIPIPETKKNWLYLAPQYSFEL